MARPFKKATSSSDTYKALNPLLNAGNLLHSSRAKFQHPDMTAEVHEIEHGGDRLIVEKYCRHGWIYEMYVYNRSDWLSFMPGRKRNQWTRRYVGR